ncbi:hypothetical protein CDIK_3351 [Cucumispora dikerogammari]|nr:hypothetical protein CDIK_3351 [Cucumispora dikerogammari]
MINFKSPFYLIKSNNPLKANKNNLKKIKKLNMSSVDLKKNLLEKQVNINNINIPKTLEIKQPIITVYNKPIENLNIKQTNIASYKTHLYIKDNEKINKLKSIYKKYILHTEINNLLIFKKVNINLNIKTLKIFKEIHILSIIYQKYLKSFEKTSTLNIIRYFNNDINKLKYLDDNMLIELLNILDKNIEKNINIEKLKKPLNKILMQKINDELNNPPAICNIEKFLKFLKNDVLMPLKIKYLHNRFKIMEKYLNINIKICFEIIKNELIYFCKIFLISNLNMESNDLILFKNHCLSLFIKKKCFENVLEFLIDDSFVCTNHSMGSKFHFVVKNILLDVVYSKDCNYNIYIKDIDL